MPQIRPSAVAGAFYPSNPSSIRKLVQDFLDSPAMAVEPEFSSLRGLLVPHAGYIYSGATAGKAYRLLAKANPLPKTIILLGPAHRVYLEGMAVPQVDGFSTPLGELTIATGLRDSLQDLPFVTLDDEPHRFEHALEVQLPFLQMVLRDFSILPVVLGRVTPVDVVEFLEQVVNTPEVLVVVSTDLSHFHPYAQACEMDHQTINQIQALQEIDDPSRACGSVAVNGWLRYARQHALKPHFLDYCNSGDTAGSKMEVVGYCAFAFTH